MAEFSNYPNKIDTTTEIPKATDRVTVVSAELFNRLRNAVLAVENELGIQPSSTFSTVKDRLDAMEANFTGTIGPEGPAGPTGAMGPTGPTGETPTGTVDMIQAYLASRDDIGALASRNLDSNIIDVTAPVSTYGLHLHSEIDATTNISESPPGIKWSSYAWHPISNTSTIVEIRLDPVFDNANGFFGLCFGSDVLGTHAYTIKFGITGDIYTENTVTANSFGALGEPGDNGHLGIKSSNGRPYWRVSGSNQELAYLGDVPSVPAASGATPTTATPTVGSGGVATTWSRSDHSHQVVVSAPIAIGISADSGVANSLSRSDHRHAHGNVSGGSWLHAEANGAAAGFESTAHYTKTEGIEAGADVTDETNVRAALAAATGDIDCNAQKLTDVANGTAQQDVLTVAQGNRTALVQFDFTTLSALAPGVKVATTTLLAAVDFPTNGVIIGVSIELPAKFSNGGAATYVVRVGISGSENIIVANTDVQLATALVFPSAGVAGVNAHPGLRLGALVTDIIAEIESDTDFNGAVAAGLVNIRLVYSSTAT